MTAFHDQQPVAECQQGWTMRYNEDGQMTAQTLKRAYQCRFRDRVKDHVGLIQREYARPVCESTDDVDLLSGRHWQVVGDPATKHGFVSVRKQIDDCFETHQLRHLAGKITLLRTKDGEIFHDCAGKYHRSGSDIGDVSSCGREGPLDGGDATNCDAARGRFDVALNKLQKGRAAGAVLALDTDH